MRHTTRRFRLPSDLRGTARSPWTFIALAFVAVFASQTLAGRAMAQSQPQLAPVQNEGSSAQVPNQYIVVFRPGTPRNVVTSAQERIRGLGGTITHTYTGSPTGFTVRIPQERARAERAMQALRALPGVEYIEANQRYSFDTVVNQNNPPTGLDRITQRLLPLDTIYSHDGQGAGVHAYVIDSGTLVTHNEFGGRASWGFSVTGVFADCLGHGTHVAATIGGTTFGVAKAVTLHAVRVGNASCIPTAADVIAGVQWVTNNRVLPAVANMSLGGPASAAMDAAVNASIASGVTYVISAGNSNADACNVSPARVPDAITVGNSDPTNDVRAATSNFGACLDLFAPGQNILSAWSTNNTATNTISGTSMSAPHVTGVAARYLASFPASTPAQVWNRIDLIANVFPGTASWPGITNPGAGSPNKLLHWGAIDDASDDGDPHITTVRGVQYDFQSAGEFVALRDRNGLEIQTRQTAVSTQPPIANPYTGLATCVSINTAVAARVGTRRVTYQPDLTGQSVSGGLQLRVDGVLTTLGTQPINLGSGGRVMKSAVGSGIEIDFPDGTSLIAIPNFWGAPHNKWYLNLSVFRTPASEGVMGALAPGSWLPALSDGSSLGPKPAALPQRFSDLYGKFADSWRVTGATTLFDYASGTSTTTFTVKNWPPEKPPCVIPESPPTKPVAANVAERLCAQVSDKNRRANCVFDVGITGEAGFAKIYLLSQQIRAGATQTSMSNKDRSQTGEAVTFVATVALKAAGSRSIPSGAIQFIVDGAKSGTPVKLDAKGRAALKTQRLAAGEHRVGAVYIPAKGSAFLASSSFERPHSVIREATR